MTKSFPDTDSPGKRSSEAFIRSWINPWSTGKSGKIIGLVGPNGARHVGVWQSYGYLSPEQMIMVERMEVTAQVLKRWAHSTQPSISIMHALIEKAIPALVKTGAEITMIDCDGVDSYGKLQHEILRLAVKHSIPNVALTFSMRHNSKAYLQLCELLGQEKQAPHNSSGVKLSRWYTDKRFGKATLRYRADHFHKCDIVPIHVRRMVENYGYCVSPFFSYRGLCPDMATICVSKTLKKEN